MSSGASGVPISHFAEIHAGIIENHDEVFLVVELVEIRYALYAFAAQIHVCQRLDEDNLLFVDASFGNESPESGIMEILLSELLPQEIQIHEAYVMSGSFVFLSGIP